MNVGELFVNLGIKGAEKTVDGLKGMTKGLKDAASSSLATKAALVGVFYAFERLLSSSAGTGNKLTNAASALGMTTDVLQRYGQAATIAGSSNEEMLATFQKLQSAATQIKIGKNVPGGLALVNALTSGELGKFDPDDAMKNPEKFFQRLALYAQKEKRVGLRNEMLGTFGISAQQAGMMARGAFSPAKIQDTSILAEKEIERLNEVYEKLAKLEVKIKLALDRFVAAHGDVLVKGLGQVVSEVVKLAEAFTTLAEKIHLFDGIQKAFEGWTKIFAGMTEATEFVGDMFSDDPKKKEKAKKQFNEKMEEIQYDLGNVAEFLMGEVKDVGKGVIDSVTGKGEAPKKTLEGLPNTQPQPKSGVPNLVLVPPPPATAPAGATQNVNMTQNLNFQHDGKNAQRVADDSARGVKGAFRQMPSLTQSN